ncbi:MAG: ComEC/Rec2 family competence protein [Actinomycetota bacterium]|nr:ComEC/Rec2 family competence protein [Actinomycetota bacterium]
MGGALARIWLTAGGLWVGITYGWSRGFAPPVLIAGLVAACSLALRRRPFARLVAIISVAVVLGAVGAGFRAQRVSPLEAMAHDVPSCILSGSVIEATGLGTLTAIRHLVCEGRVGLDRPGNVFLDIRGHPGGTVRAEGWLIPLTHDPFDVARRRAGGDAAFAPTTIDVHPPQGGVFALAASIRAGLERATASLDPRAAALVHGLTLGDTDSLDPASVERFRRAGLAHLLAVSGTNVAIVLGTVAWAARRLPHKLRIAAGAMTLALFVLVVGPDPSVLRAAAMGGIGLIALSMNRTAEPLYALGLALIVLLGARPAMVGSVGLQLSAAATAGIVLWSGGLARRLPLPGPLSVPLAVTLAAQAGVAPILIGTFGELSLIAPVANLLAVPAVAPATVLGIGAGLLGAAHPALGAAAAQPLAPLASWILWVGDMCGAPAWAAAEVPKAVAWAITVPLVAAARTASRARHHGDRGAGR